MLRFFEGHAGTGKTTRLMSDLGTRVKQGALRDGQRVLALTKMHGSRRRLHRRLLEVPGLRRRFDCLTIDSFAWNILRRWRSLVRTLFEQLEPEDYNATCQHAGALMGQPHLPFWIARRYPVVVVDELQDSKRGQLALIQSLEPHVQCIAAADDFQDLNPDGQSESVLWARSRSESAPLEKVFRTDAAGLLSAARALREGRAVSKGQGFTVLGAHNKNVGASFVSRNLTYWRSTDDIAVLSPSGPSKSKFVREVLARVAEKPFKKDGQSFGPHAVPWETTQEQDEAEFLEQTGLDKAEGRVTLADIASADNRIARKQLTGWFDRQRRLGGIDSHEASGVRAQVSLIFRRVRAYWPRTGRRVRAMLFHQAKNREFDSVIVLWPYGVPSDADQQRRLLYNAVTRAKRRALLVVENPRRLKQPPFTVN